MIFAAKPSNLSVGINERLGILVDVDTFDESAGDNRSKSRVHSPPEINGDNITGHSARRRGAWRRRLGPLTERNFRVFYAGYATSLLGTSMSRIALTFAVLDNGGGAADLGYVFAANVVPQVLVMLGGECSPTALAGGRSC